MILFAFRPHLAPNSTVKECPKIAEQIPNSPFYIPLGVRERTGP